MAATSANAGSHPRNRTDCGTRDEMAESTDFRPGSSWGRDLIMLELDIGDEPIGIDRKSRSGN